MVKCGAAENAVILNFSQLWIARYFRITAIFLLTVLIHSFYAPLILSVSSWFVVVSSAILGNGWFDSLLLWIVCDVVLNLLQHEVVFILTIYSNFRYNHRLASFGCSSKNIKLKNITWNIVTHYAFLRLGHLWTTRFQLSCATSCGQEVFDYLER